MSSHHFVRDGQEPALLIIDAISFELAQPLLEWAPLVIVLDAALDDVLGWGIKIDVVLAVQHEVEKIKEKVLDQDPVEVISYETSDNPLIMAFSFLLSNNQADVNIMAESSNATIFVVIQNSLAKLNVVVLNKDCKWSFVVSGEYSKWFPAKMRIKILRSTDEQNFSTEGIDPHHQEYYEVPEDGQIIIRSEGNFWVGEEIDVTERRI